MLKSILIIMLLIFSSVKASFLPGQSVPDKAFTELKFNNDGTVDSLDKNLHTILNDGRTVIIYFFTITFS